MIAYGSHASTGPRDLRHAPVPGPPQSPRQVAARRASARGARTRPAAGEQPAEARWAAAWRHLLAALVGPWGEKSPMDRTPPPPATRPAAPLDPERVVVWVDGVGGYLLCTRAGVSLGQPVGGARNDVALMADVSRRHAEIVREGDAYRLEARQPVRVNGQPARGPVLLGSGARLELGDSVVLRFVRPHPLSATARLEFLSRHRTQPLVDGVLLVAESVILGPNPRAHIVCPDWSRDLVLYRREGQWRCRGPEAFEVDGRPAQHEAALGPTSRIVLGDAALSLEPVVGQ